MLRWRGPELGQADSFFRWSSHPEIPTLLRLSSRASCRQEPSPQDPPQENISRESPEPLTFAIKFSIFVSDVRGLEALPTDGAAETGLVPRLRSRVTYLMRGQHLCFHVHTLTSASEGVPQP